MEHVKKNLLFISESRKRPITKSLLYKQIVRFFKEEGIEGYFDIVFISIADGIIEARYGARRRLTQNTNFPPARFRGGRTWVKKEQIKEIAENISKYLYKNGNKYSTKIAYVRGAYLEAVRLAVEKTGTEIAEVFSDDELAQLKKKGIMWMKVGLRMPVAFTIFRMKMRYMVMENKNGQLRLSL